MMCVLAGAGPFPWSSLGALTAGSRADDSSGSLIAAELHGSVADTMQLNTRPRGSRVGVESKLWQSAMMCFAPRLHSALGAGCWQFASRHLRGSRARCRCGRALATCTPAESRRPRAACDRPFRLPLDSVGGDKLSTRPFKLMSTQVE